jgi:hypothetical protein
MAGAGANMRTLGILVVALALAGTAVAGPLEDGVEAVDRGDYATALRLLQPLAEKGDPDAQINLGNMYNAESLKCYLLAADAQIALGFLYEYGEAVPQDYVQAVHSIRSGRPQKTPILAFTAPSANSLARAMAAANVKRRRKLEHDGWIEPHRSRQQFPSSSR